jgi:hypothetical protein
MSQFLFASKIVLGRLNRCVPQQKLNLFELAASQVAQSCAGTAQVMRSEILDTGTFRGPFDDMPDGFRCEALAPDLSWPAYSPEERTCTYLGCVGPLIHGALRPRWNRDCADVLSFANKVGDHPMFLAHLKISHPESHQFGASEAASNEQRQNRSITFAPQTIRLQFCEQGSGLIDGQPVSDPNAQAFCALNSTDSGCQFGTQKARVSCLVCETSHSR